MSNCIVPGHAGAPARITSFRQAVEVLAPPRDSVELWLTPTVEQDFEQRGAFPELRRPLAVAVRAASGWALHVLRGDLAELVLADCIRRTGEVCGGTLNAYHGHERRLREAIEEARSREVLLDASGPRHAGRFCDQERWIGTQAHFEAMGITGFAAHPERMRWRTKDSRGFPAHVCGSSSLWPGLFEVTITLPRVDREKPSSVDRGATLAVLAPTAQAFRARQMDALNAVATLFRDRMQLEVGYRFTPEVVDEFLSVLAEAQDVLRSGQIVGRSRDSEIALSAARQARADQPLQTFLARMKNAPWDPDA